MTPGEAVSRKQRGILDDAGCEDVSVEATVGETPKWADLWAIDPDYPLPDFTSSTDDNGVEWHTITDARTTRYRPFGAPTSEPWQRRDDTPTYQGRHRRASYIPFLCSCRACRPVAS